MGKTEKKLIVQSHPGGHGYFCYIQKAPEIFANVLGEDSLSPYLYLYIYKYTLGRKNQDSS